MLVNCDGRRIGSPEFDDLRIWPGAGSPLRRAGTDLLGGGVADRHTVVMAGYRSGAREMPASASMQWLRAVVFGRQTRTDVIATATLLAIASGLHLYTAHLAWDAFRGQGECTPLACVADGRFDLVAIVLVLSLVLGLTLGLRSVLRMLNRRNAWVYALGDVAVAGVCMTVGIWLLGGL
jgi:hypothetical protein